MQIRGSVVSLSFIFPHPPEDEKNKKKLAPLPFAWWCGCPRTWAALGKLRVDACIDRSAPTCSETPHVNSSASYPKSLTVVNIEVQPDEKFDGPQQVHNEKLLYSTNEIPTISSSSPDRETPFGQSTPGMCYPNPNTRRSDTVFICGTSRLHMATPLSGQPTAVVLACTVSSEARRPR